jgi:hypothetical protein
MTTEKKDKDYDWVGSVIDSCRTESQTFLCLNLAESFLSLHKDELLYNRLVNFIKQKQEVIELGDSSLT